MRVYFNLCLFALLGHRKIILEFCISATRSLDHKNRSAIIKLIKKLINGDYHRYLIYTRQRICISKVKPKISAVSSHSLITIGGGHIGRSQSSKKAKENTILFCICVLNTFWLHKTGFVVNFVHFRNTKYTNYHASSQLCGNDQRLRFGFNFRLPTVWEAPSSVYETSMMITHSHAKLSTIH